MPEGKSEHPAQKRGFVGKSIDLILKVIGLLLFSAFMSIVIEWINMGFFQDEPTYKNAEEMMFQEIGYLSESLTSKDQTNEGAVNSASSTITKVVSFLFVDSGLLDSLQSVRTPDANDGQIILMMKGVIAEYYEYLMAAIYILIMFFVRIAVLMLSMPAFVLFGVVGVCDGLMQRDLRRWRGGNESGYVYHWAKKFAIPTLALAWILYLAIPSSIHPNYMITPFAVLFGLCLMVMSSKFKKYL